jgi:hypothetical protein
VYVATIRPDVTTLEFQNFCTTQVDRPFNQSVGIRIVVKTDTICDAPLFSLAWSQLTNSRINSRRTMLSNLPEMGLRMRPQRGFRDERDQIYLMLGARSGDHICGIKMPGHILSVFAITRVLAILMYNNENYVDGR